MFAHTIQIRKLGVGTLGSSLKEHFASSLTKTFCHMIGMQWTSFQQSFCIKFVLNFFPTNSNIRLFWSPHPASLQPSYHILLCRRDYDSLPHESPSNDDQSQYFDFLYLTIANRIARFDWENPQIPVVTTCLDLGLVLYCRVEHSLLDLEHVYLWSLMPLWSDFFRIDLYWDFVFLSRRARNWSRGRKSSQRFGKGGPFDLHRSRRTKTIREFKRSIGKPNPIWKWKVSYGTWYLPGSLVQGQHPPDLQRQGPHGGTGVDQSLHPHSSGSRFTKGLRQLLVRGGKFSRNFKVSFVLILSKTEELFDQRTSENFR